MPLPGAGGRRVSATDATASRTESARDGELLVVVDHLSRHFRLGGPRSRRIVKAVDDVSLVLNRGETVGLVGESGLGKSTLARLLLRLDEPDWAESTSTRPTSSASPRASCGGCAARCRSSSRPVRVAEQAKDGRDRLVPAHRPRTLTRSGSERAGGGTARARRPPAERERLSAPALRGQCQRVSIARALALHPKLVVLDEAVSAVDVSIQAQILNLLRGLQDRLDLTYLFVTHDLAVVRYMADTIAVMYLGRIVEEGPRDCSSRIHSIRTRTRSWPRSHRRPARCNGSRSSSARRPPPTSCRRAAASTRAAPRPARALPDGRPAPPRHGRGTHGRVSLSPVGRKPAGGGRAGAGERRPPLGRAHP